MPRMARKNQKYQFFHVMVQRIAKRQIFLDDIDKCKYIDLIYKNSTRAKIDIIAYCVMKNHVHLVLYTPEVDNMTAFFRYTNTSFARTYNNAHNRVGYVFRDRYKSKPIRNLKQLIVTINYVHNNPVKANKCSSPRNYQFSSYSEYLNEGKIINKKILRKFFSDEEFKKIFII